MKKKIKTKQIKLGKSEAILRVSIYMSQKIDWLPIQYLDQVYKEDFFLQVYTRESKAITYSKTELQNTRLLTLVALDLTHINKRLTLSKVKHSVKPLSFRNGILLQIVILKLKRYLFSQSDSRFLTSFLLFCVITNLECFTP